MNDSLNRFDLLPAELDQDVARILDAAIVGRRLRQSDALEQLNMLVAPLGVAPLSSSGFNRLVKRWKATGIPARWQIRPTAAVQPQTMAARIEALEQRVAFLERRPVAGQIRRAIAHLVTQWLVGGRT